MGPARARSARRDGARRLRWARAAPAARPLAQGGGADSSLSYLKVFTNTAQALLEDRTSAQSGVLTISYLKVFTNTAQSLLKYLKVFTSGVLTISYRKVFTTRHRAGS